MSTLTESSQDNLGWVYPPAVSPSTPLTTFLALSDTPNSYVGKGGKVVAVKSTQTGLEFVDVATGTGSGSDYTGPTFINVLDYGAVPDMVTLFDITMPNGNVITSAGHTFTTADIGKWTVVRGATNAGVSPLVAQITAVSGHTATLSKATTSALTNLNVSDSFPRMDFGTDNSLAIIFACLAVPGPGNRNFYNSTPFTAAGVLNPILPGDGGTVYIPRGNYLMLPYAVGVGLFWWIESNNYTVKGDGMGQTVLFMNSAWTMPLFGVGATHGLFQNITFQDYTIHDLNYYTGTGNTLNVQFANNVRIERIEIRNSRGNGGINYQGYNITGTVPLTSRLYIRDCWVHGITEDGYTPAMYHSIEGDGMNVGQMTDVHIEGNTIYRPGRHAYEGGGNCYDQYFIGNTIDMGNGGASGINPTGGNTTVVMGNTIKNVSAGNFGIDFTVDVGSAFVANDIRCIGNYVHGNMQGAFRFQNTSGDTSTDHLDRIIVANNWVQGDTNASTAGILFGGGAGEHPSMLITGNWFGNTGFGLTAVAGLFAATGKWIIVRGNVFAHVGGQPADDDCLSGNIIIEDNVLPAAAANRYGGKGMSCNIDGNNVLAGAIYSNTATGLLCRTTDQVEVVRGATTAPSLIIWAVVTSVVGTGYTVTTYAYNPTGGTLNTGASTTYIVHRRLP